MVEAASEHPLVGSAPASDVVAEAAMTFRGYCGACGTWDEHGSICACCGYGFNGDLRTPAVDED